MTTAQVLLFYIYMLCVHFGYILIPTYLRYLNQRKSVDNASFRNTLKSTSKYFFSWVVIPFTFIISQHFTNYLYILDTIQRGDGAPPGGFFYYGIFVIPFFWFTSTALIMFVLIFVIQRRHSFAQSLALYAINIAVSIGNFLTLLIGLILYFWVLLSFTS